MSDHPAAQRAESFVRSNKDAWEQLVRLCCDHRFNRDKLAKSLARLVDGSPESIGRKIRAIDNAKKSGMTCEAIIAAGQKVILGDSKKQRNQDRETETVVRARMFTSLADAWKDQLARIGRVCKLTTTNEVFEFLNSFLVDMPDEVLLHHSGGQDEPKNHSKRR